MTDILDLLAARRRQLRLTQRGIAKQLGTFPAHISRLENKQHGPTLRTIYWYANALGCELDIRLRDIKTKQIIRYTEAEEEVY